MGNGKVEIPPESMQMFGNAENLAIRTVILINGAAAVAILAFVGTIWTLDKQGSIGDLSTSLFWFVIGVGCGFLASLLNYLAFHIAIRKPKSGTIDSNRAFKKWFDIRHKLVRKFTYTVMILLSIGFFCFIYGTYQANKIFQKPPPVELKSPITYEEAVDLLI